MGRSGHTVFDRITPRDAAEMEFLRRVAAQIDSAVAGRRVGELVLCAPPRALGLLRDFISPATRKRLTAELVKDIVREPLDLIDHRMKENRV
jgi:protein required for attachment to host cells